LALISSNGIGCIRARVRRIDCADANRIGYFIMKTTTLDKLTNEIADTRAELADTRASLAETGAAFQAYIWKLQEQNRALKRQLGGPE
jgi:hypothetical protein